MSELPAVHFGPFRLLGRHGPLLRDDREIKLQRKALAVLWTLANQPNEPVTRTDLMDAVWPGAIVIDDVLTYQIRALRQAIEDDPRNPRYIVTAHRIGFRLTVPIGSESAAAARTMIGRESELRALGASFDRAAGGQRQFVFVCGEAGIGKTTLLDEFLLRLRSEAPEARVLRGQCLELTGESEAYLPILDALEQGVRGAGGEEWLELLRRNAPSWLRQLPKLLPSDELEQLRRISAGTPPDHQRRELSQALEVGAASQPLVLVLEDLHWSDASTITLLSMLAQRDQPACLLVIASCRPVESIITQHPVRALQMGLTSRGRAQALYLNHLGPEDGRRLIARHLADVSDEQSDELMRRSGGHPLFLVHLTDYLRMQSLAPPAGTGLDRFIPPQLRELIELQLAQLTVSEQLLLEVAAVAGQDFAAATVAAGSSLEVEAVEEALEGLAQRRCFIVDDGLAIWPDGTVSGRFQFQHALYREALRLRLAPSREARLHRRIAERLEHAYAGRPADIATELAHHFEAGGVAVKAAHWCVHTAQNALDRLASHEVREQVARGLALLDSAAPGPTHPLTELRLRIAASQNLQIEYGYAPVASDDHRDRIDALIEQVDDDQVRALAIAVQWASRHFNLEFERAIAFSERMRDIGRASGNISLECVGLGWAAHSLHCTGAHEEADLYTAGGLQKALAVGGSGGTISDDSLVSLYCARAVTRWFMGFPEQALAAAKQGVAIAGRHPNPYLHVMVHGTAHGMLLDFIGDYPQLKTVATGLLEQARNCGHVESQRWARVLLGVAQCRTGDPETGVQTLQTVLDEMRERGLVIQVPLGLTHLARAWSALGDHERALDTAEAALQLIRTRHHRPWEPEVLRTIGELQLIARPEAIAEASAWIREALALARTRKALSLELRAATSLARLLQRQGKNAEALAVLDPVLGRFTEGRHLPDLRDAASLIAELQHA
jgi:DNA-binding winged helix-turn-helix (wHTH) protein/tetratricopeptide (TPR) repeat protein